MDAETDVPLALIPMVSVFQRCGCVERGQFHLASYFNARRDTLLETYRVHGVHGGD